jgi:predicted RNA binding protein YcfA (HicA-like mRNA interferase family)
MPKMTWKQPRELIETDGWILKSQSGSHRHFEHLFKPGKTTLAQHRIGGMVPQGTLQNVLRHAGLKS